MFGALSANIMTGTITATTAPLIHQMLSLLRKRSFEAEDTMADWKESKALVERDTTRTRTMPTTQAGSVSRSMKKAIEPSSTTSVNAPDQVAIRPVEPTSA